MQKQGPEVRKKIIKNENPCKNQNSSS